METMKNSISGDAAYTDEALIKLLSGFTNGYAKVNGISLHYVEGGQGEPLVLLPGWPQTWWSYHKIMPLLATRYHIIVVDIRGMGSSDKPADGYEKKMMARDIFELTRNLGYEKINIAGHDIGAHVAFSFAANFPDATSKLIMLDTPHPDEGMYRLPMLPMAKLSTQKQEGHVYPWWVAFNQVKELPEQLLVGRIHYVHDYVFKHVSVNESSIGQFDREVYAAAYNYPEAIRAGNAWYQAFPQDIRDSKTYSRLAMPVLGIGGSGYDILTFSLTPTTTDLKLAQVQGSGHFIMEEKPQETVDCIINFLS